MRLENPLIQNVSIKYQFRNKHVVEMLNVIFINLSLIVQITSVILFLVKLVSKKILENIKITHLV